MNSLGKTELYKLKVNLFCAVKAQNKFSYFSGIWFTAKEAFFKGLALWELKSVA